MGQREIFEYLSTLKAHSKTGESEKTKGRLFSAYIISLYILHLILKEFLTKFIIISMLIPKEETDDLF